MDEQKRKKLEQVVQTEFPGLIATLERILDFKRWGFTKVFWGVGKFAPIVVYGSNFCRVMFAWQIPDLRDENATIAVRYGRLHAPYDEDVLTWNGQKCYCWHEVRKVLFFLDRLSAGQAASDRFLWPKIMEQFREMSVNKGWKQPEYMARMHATIWEHYGQTLFDLFDLRQPSLWEEYSRFMKEYQEIRQESSSSGYPDRDKVC